MATSFAAYDQQTTEDVNRETKRLETEYRLPNWRVGKSQPGPCSGGRFCNGGVGAVPAMPIGRHGFPRPPANVSKPSDVRKWCCLLYFKHAVSPRLEFYNAFGRRCHRDPIFALHYKHGPRLGEHFKHAVSPRPNSSDTFGRRCHRDPIFAIHYKHGPRPGEPNSRTLRNFIPGRDQNVELESKYNGRNPSFNFLSNSTIWSRPGMKFRKVREYSSPGRGPCL